MHPADIDHGSDSSPFPPPPSSLLLSVGEGSLRRVSRRGGDALDLRWRRSPPLLSGLRREEQARHFSGFEIHVWGPEA